MLVDVGDLVRKGQPIARLDELQLQLEVKHTEALLAQACAAIGLDPHDAGQVVSPEQSPVVKQERALLEQATLDLERARTLRRQGVTTQEDLDQREADYKVAVARYAASLNSVGEKIALIQVRRSEVELAKNAVAESTIFAPFDGIVEERNTAAGAYVKTGDPVVSMVRCDRVRFLGAVPEKQAHLVTLGQEVHIHLRNEPQPRAVQVSRLRPQIDPASRALMFEADIENADFRLQPGLFAEADLVVDATAQAVVVPESAVVEFAGVEKVWRVVDGVAQEAVIRTGDKRGGQVLVSSGVEPGDVIVTQGAQGRAGKIQIATAPAMGQEVGVAE
jgi:RND family efflux transporter MFP subunit